MVMKSLEVFVALPNILIEKVRLLEEIKLTACESIVRRTLLLNNKFVCDVTLVLTLNLKFLT